ncbi:MAG: RNA polymerase sigma factor, partial [Myxococcota bacterium]
LGRLYEEVGHLVFRRCLQILRNPEEAMDAVQWTFVRAIETGFVVRTRGEALSWLYQTASRRCLWVMRNSSNRSRITDRHRPELAPPPAAALEADLVSRDLMTRALDGMSDDAAQLVLMTYVWGYTNDRAAELAGTSVRTVGRARADFEARMRDLAGREVVS